MPSTTVCDTLGVFLLFEFCERIVNLAILKRG